MSFSCATPGCDRQFNNPTMLKLHDDKVHRGKEFKCRYCGKQTSDSSGLRKHVKICKQNPAEPDKYACGWGGCTYQAVRKDNVVRHIRRDCTFRDAEGQVPAPVKVAVHQRQGAAAAAAANEGVVAYQPALDNQAIQPQQPPYAPIYQHQQLDDWSFLVASEGHSNVLQEASSASETDPSLPSAEVWSDNPTLLSRSDSDVSLPLVPLTGDEDYMDMDCELPVVTWTSDDPFLLLNRQ
jgi:hypothetical protein